MSGNNKLQMLINDALDDCPYVYKDKNGKFYYNVTSEHENIDDIINLVRDFINENKFVSADDFWEKFNEFLYEEFQDSEMEMWHDIVEYVWDEVKEFDDLISDKEDLWDFLDGDEPYANYDFERIYDAHLNCVVALTNTNGEMNYDFSDSNLWEIRRHDSGSGEDGEFSFEDFEELHNSNKFLCLSQGESMEMLYDAIFDNRNTKISPFIDSLVQEYENATYGGCVVFLCSLPLKDFINIKFGKANIVVSSNATGGIFDWTNGSGGPLELELNNDIYLKNGMFELYVDGTVGYGIDETYGLMDSEWKENVIAISNIRNKDKRVLEGLIAKYGVDKVVNKLTEALDKPLFRTPVKFVNRQEDDVNNVINIMINDGEIDYADIYDLDINDSLIDEIMERARLYDIDNMSTRRWVMNIISNYYENAYAEHLDDIDEGVDMGQYRTATERRERYNDRHTNDGNYYSEVRRLRRMLDDTDDLDEIEAIQNKIDNLKVKYGMNEGKVNEWNMWDGMPRERQVTRVNYRPSQPVNTRRYEDEPEYHNHIKRLEDQLENTTDEQEREYLWRRIEKLKSLSSRNRY